MAIFRDFWIAVFFMLVAASIIHAVWWPVDFGMWLRKIHQAFYGNITFDPSSIPPAHLYKPVHGGYPS